MNRPEIIGYSQDGPMDQWGAKLQRWSADAACEGGEMPLVGTGSMVSWPGEWSLVDGEIRVRATIPTKNPPQNIVVKIDLNELKNRIFRAQLQALLAS